MVQKTGEVRVGMGWVCAAVPRSWHAPPPAECPAEGDRQLIQQFLDLAFSKRDARAAFGQFVDLKRFTGHLSDGSHTALETLSRLQLFVEESEGFTIRGVVMEASSGFARVERLLVGTTEPRQLLMQVSVSDGKIVDYCCALQR